MNAFQRRAYPGNGLLKGTTWLSPECERASAPKGFPKTRKGSIELPNRVHVLALELVDSARLGMHSGYEQPAIAVLFGVLQQCRWIVQLVRTHQILLDQQLGVLEGRNTRKFPKDPPPDKPPWLRSTRWLPSYRPSSPSDPIRIARKCNCAPLEAKGPDFSRSESSSAQTSSIGVSASARASYFGKSTSYAAPP